MKKIILVLLVLVLILGLGACGENLDGEVVLNSLTSEDVQQVKGVKDNKTRNLDYQYKILEHTEDIINIKMELDNPNNYYIFDFKLISNNPNLEILIDDEFVKLDTIFSIRWNGVTNMQTFFTLKLNSTEDTIINLDNIYFSDKQSGESKFEVDLNNKSEFTVFRTTPFEVELLNYSDGKYQYEVTYDERVIVDGLEGNIYYSETPNFTLTYSYTLGDIIVSDSYSVVEQDLIEVKYINTELHFFIYVEKYYFDNIYDLTIKVTNSGNLFYELLGVGNFTYESGWTGHLVLNDNLDGMTIEVYTNGFVYIIKV